MATADEVSANLHSVLDDVANSILGNSGPVGFGSGIAEQFYGDLLEHFNQHGTSGAEHNKRVRQIVDAVKGALG